MEIKFGDKKRDRFRSSSSGVFDSVILAFVSREPNRGFSIRSRARSRVTNRKTAAPKIPRKCQDVRQDVCTNLSFWGL